MKGDNHRPPEHNAQITLTSPSSKKSEAFVFIRRTLPKSLKLRNRGQFIFAQQQGQRIQTLNLIVYLVSNPQMPTRLGITVSKKVGKAHYRAYLKRLLREAFRHSKLRESSGFDVSLIAKRGLSTPRLSDLITELDSLQYSPKRKSKKPSKYIKSKRDHQEKYSPVSQKLNSLSSSTNKEER